MKSILRFIDSLTTAPGANQVLVGLIVAVTAASARGQGEIASGTVSSTGSGPYAYNLTFSDAAGAGNSVGSVWYAWIPGAFYLPGTPTGASAPTGWSATVNMNSVEYVASSAAYYITAGSSLSGFSYTATFTPAQLAAAPNSGKSTAYSAGLFTPGDPGNIFVVSAIPEPSAQLLLIPGLLCLAAWRKFRASLAGARA